MRVSTLQRPAPHAYFIWIPEHMEEITTLAWDNWMIHNITLKKLSYFYDYLTNKLNITNRVAIKADPINVLKRSSYPGSNSLATFLALFHSSAMIKVSIASLVRSTARYVWAARLCCFISTSLGPVGTHNILNSRFQSLWNILVVFGKKFLN